MKEDGELVVSKKYNKWENLYRLYHDLWRFAHFEILYTIPNDVFYVIYKYIMNNYPSLDESAGEKRRFSSRKDEAWELKEMHELDTFLRFMRLERYVERGVYDGGMFRLTLNLEYEKECKVFAYDIVIHQLMLKLITQFISFNGKTIYGRADLDDFAEREMDEERYQNELAEQRELKEEEEAIIRKRQLRIEEEQKSAKQVKELDTFFNNHNFNDDEPNF